MSFAEPEASDVLDHELSDNRSLLASGAALVVMVLAIFLIDAGWFSSLFMMFLTGAAIVVILWTATWFLALRRGSNWMALASFLALLFVGLGGMTWKYWNEWRSSTVESGRSRQKLLDTLYASPGRINVVADSGGGSLTIIGRYLNKVLDDRNLYHKSYIDLGAPELLEVPETSGAKQLSNCGGFAALKEISIKAKANGRSYAKSVRASLENADLGRRQKTELLAEFDIVQKHYLPMQDRLWDLRSEIADGITKRCNVLARRNWTPNGAGVMFNNQPDYNAYGAATKALQKLLQEEFESQNAALRKTVDELNAL
jgi:hypothetical protein